MTLTDADLRPESFYNPMLPAWRMSWMPRASRRSSTAPWRVPAGFKNREGYPLPLIIVKSDGGYLYATTDLAASATASTS